MPRTLLSKVLLILIISYRRTLQISRPSLPAFLQNGSETSCSPSHITVLVKLLHRAMKSASAQRAEGPGAPGEPLCPIGRGSVL